MRKPFLPPYTIVQVFIAMVAVIHFIKRFSIAAAPPVIDGEYRITMIDKVLDQRKIIHPLFLPKRIDSYGQIVVDKTSLMCKEWEDGRIMDIHKEMMNVTLKIICKSIMNYEIDSEEASKFSSALEVSK